MAIQPNKALVELWDRLADPEARAEARRMFEQMPDDCRRVMNLWANLEPAERDAFNARVLEGSTP